jgi:hypothetical protein
MQLCLLFLAQQRNVCVALLDQGNYCRYTPVFILRRAETFPVGWQTTQLFPEKVADAFFQRSNEIPMATLDTLLFVNCDYQNKRKINENYPYFTKFRRSYQSHLYEVDMKFSLAIFFSYFDIFFTFTKFEIWSKSGSRK